MKTKKKTKKKRHRGKCHKFSMYTVAWTEMEDAKLEIRPQNPHTHTVTQGTDSIYAAGESFC